jgi:hypothetical protein
MVRDAGAAADRRARKIAVSGEDYKEGVENPREDWLTRVKATEAKRDAELRKAMEEGRITKGAEECGTQRQIDKTVSKGVPAWQAEAASDEANAAYQKGMEPVIDCVKVAKAEVAKLPETTRAQRIARSARYQVVMGECMDKKKGRRS